MPTINHRPIDPHTGLPYHTLDGLGPAYLKQEGQPWDDDPEWHSSAEYRDKRPMESTEAERPLTRSLSDLSDTSLAAHCPRCGWSAFELAAGRCWDCGYEGGQPTNTTTPSGCPDLPTHLL